jgi:type IV pilus assembly protein PilW
MKQGLKKNGFTIIELVIAMGIGIFVLGSMAILFINSKSMVITQNNVGKIQEDSRFGLFIMGNDIQNAGFRGCSSGLINPSSGVVFNNVSGAANYNNATNFIQGSSGSGTFSPALDASVSAFSPAPNANTDVLTVRSVSGEPVTITADMVNPTDALTLTSATGFTAASNAIITNCLATSVFKISTVAGAVVQPTASLNALFMTGSEVYQYSTTTFYVGTDNILYKVVNGAAPLPLAYNVEKFAVLYGINTDGTTNVNQYVPASAVPNFNKVLSVRIGVVFKGTDRNTIGTAKASYTYQFNGTTVTPNDSIVRKVFYTTIALRNMLP